MVRDDAMDLKRRVGRDDLDKLDEYFTTIRDCRENDLCSRRRGCANPNRRRNTACPRRLPDDFYREVPLFYDLMRLALQTDSTRVISFAVNGWGRTSGLPGVTKGYHDLTHHGRDENKLKQLSIVETFHTSQLARFVEGLKRTQVVGRNFPPRPNNGALWQRPRQREFALKSQPADALGRRRFSARRAQGVQPKKGHDYTSV